MRRFLFKQRFVEPLQHGEQTESGVEPFLSDVDAKSQNRANKEEFRTVRVLAKSGNSKIARVIWATLEDMKSRGVKVTAVFAPFKSKKEEQGTIGRYSEVFGGDAARANVRIARFKGAKKLSEQAQFGEMGVWDETSDPDNVGKLKVKRAKPGDLTLSAAKISFDMVWAMSDELPKQSPGPVGTKRK